MNIIKHYIMGEWVSPEKPYEPILNPANQDIIGYYSTASLNYQDMVNYAKMGGEKLRQQTLYQRAIAIKQLALYLNEHKKTLYEMAPSMGATRNDAWLDIDGGIGVLFTISSRARRHMDDNTMSLDGEMEPLSKNGTFVGQHIYVPRDGVAIHINAFNFPCWGLLEKLASTYIAGMPCIIKPAPLGSFLAVKLVELISKSHLLEEGTLQCLAMDVPKGLLSHLGHQDVVAFTGSSKTAETLKKDPSIVEKQVRFLSETDSLNAIILGKDVEEKDIEYKLFIREIIRELTSKAGQKCTAIRRILIPKDKVAQVANTLKERLTTIYATTPTENKKDKMGVLASTIQAQRVNENLQRLKKSCAVIFDGNINYNAPHPTFMNPVILESKSENKEVHDIEVFGPVATLIGYTDTHHAIELANKGGGSLVASIITHDDTLAKEITCGIAPYHGRILIINRACADESTGHGSPLPALTHGGPGRAGSNEEMGGIRGIVPYMHRVALQGHPTTISTITNTYVTGAKWIEKDKHPFQYYFEELVIGQSFISHGRTVTETDIVNFGCLSGDHFYAHFDMEAAKTSIFSERVAHGYFILSAAAGLFVYPNQGPVLANYGLDNLRFIEPVKMGDTIHVQLTVKSKKRRPKRDDENQISGIVTWLATVKNQHQTVVATYEVLTLVALK